MKTKHGVLTWEGLLTIKDNSWDLWGILPASEWTVPELMQLALDHGLTHLWIHTNSDIDPQAPLEVSKGCFKGIADGWNLLGHMTGKHIKSVYGWPMPKGNAATLIFPHYSGWGQTGRMDVPGWGKVASPKQLLVTISYLEQILGVPVGSSPGSTGWELHRKMHPEWVANFPKMNLKSMHFGEGSSDFNSSRPYNSDEGQYLHKIDKRSAHLHSCSFDTYYGVGEPTLDKDGSKCDGKRPGSWECVLVPGDRTLPHYKAGKKWLAGRTVRLLRNAGYQVEILQGWYFPNSHKILEKWAGFLRESMQSFSFAERWKRAEPREFARQAIKQIYVHTLGLAGYGGFEEDEETDKKRPDIRGETVARTYELMYWNITKFHEKTGMMPVLTYVDALYYVSDSPSMPHPDVFLKKTKTGLGEYKYEGVIEITSEVEEILNSSTSVSKKLEHLNKIGWSK
jgi:hypothetical protein